MTDLESIKRTLVNISSGNGLIDMLLEFERTLDNVELFAYKNWILGELVKGPKVTRYWFKVCLMYPYSKMPDPLGGIRLTKIGARVNFRKGIFRKPVKVTGPESWQDINSKKAKLSSHNVWLVTIKLPIKYISRGLDNIDDIIDADIKFTNKLLSKTYDEDETTETPEEMSPGGGPLEGMPPGGEMGGLGGLGGEPPPGNAPLQ